MSAPCLAAFARHGSARGREIAVEEKSLSAGAQLVHGVGQFDHLTLAGIALLLGLLTLSDLLHPALIDNPKSHEPGEIGHNQHDPEYLDLHRLSPVPFRQAALMPACTSMTVSLAECMKVKGSIRAIGRPHSDFGRADREIKVPAFL